MADRPAALIRQTADDFLVVEIPKVVPDGQGEHLMVRIRKRDANTPWVATQLARWAGVPARAVSWAGLKDRRAVTEQWYSIHCMDAQPDPDTFEVDGVELLELHRHSRKLRRGALAGNRFRIVLRELTEHAASVALAVPRIATGIPNRFGPQRFGRGGRNLLRAQRWFAGGAEPRNRMQRGMLISAARAAMFNAILDQRIAAETWATPMDGDVMMLDGRGSRFAADFSDPTLVPRCSAGEIHPSGPLWGKGGSDATGEAAACEQAVVTRHRALADGLERVAEAERRSFRVMPRALTSTVVDAGTLVLEFELPSGAYATTLLDQLVEWRVPADELEGDLDVGDD